MPGASSVTRGSSSSRTSTAGGTPKGGARAVGSPPTSMWSAHTSRILLLTPSSRWSARTSRRRRRSGRRARRRGRSWSSRSQRRSLQVWVAEQFRQRGVQAEPEASAALLQLVGDDLIALAVEVDKLATWAGDEPSGSERSWRSSLLSRTMPIYELTEAWATRDTARALAAERGDLRSRVAAAPRYRCTSCRGSRRPSRPASLDQATRREGVRSKEAAERLKLNPYYARQAVQPGRRVLAGGAARLGGAPRGARRVAQGAKPASLRISRCSVRWSTSRVDRERRRGRRRSR